MVQIFDPEVRVCLTAAGCLIHEGKVLLVKHKKLGIWLNPGGHIDENELPHKAAEREFWEETGIKVEAYDPREPDDEKTTTEYLPSPFLTNLHWISKENFEHRVNGSSVSAETKAKWSKGCEQHVSFMFLVKPINNEVTFTENVEETDGIAWFTLEEAQVAVTSQNVLLEITRAFELVR